jgi:peroxiredoxin
MIAHADESTLAQQLQTKSDESKKQMPPNSLQVLEDSIAALRKSNIMQSALRAGDRLPDFRLPDAQNKTFDSSAALAQGPLVIVFYRGGWCPFCNLQLHAMQSILPELKKAGATLVAISPQSPDNTLSTVEKAKLEFTVLSDENAKIGKSMGLIYEVSGDLKKLYEVFGLNLSKINGSDQWELPLAATYVVSQDHIIRYAFIDADYRKRAEPAEILHQVQTLRH